MYVKLFSQILSSSIADDRRLRHFFTDMLLCADAKGHVSMTPESIARVTGAPIEEVRWGLEELQKPDPRSKTPDNEGRRIAPIEGAGYGWKILNYEMYRAVRDADHLREMGRLRVARHRESAARNARNVTCNASNSKQKKNQKEKEIAEGDGITTCPAEAERVVAKPPTPVDEVVDHYRTYHSHSRPGDKERKLIASRLKDGYSVADLRDAIDGCHRSPFHSGINERGAKYQSLELIVRDSKHVAEFIEIARSGAKPTGLVNQREVEAKSTTARLIARLNLQGAENGTA